MAQSGDGEERGGAVKIELVGGPECGTVREVGYIRAELLVSGVTYARRDTPWMLSGKHGALYGERGYRFYDAVKVSANG